MGGCTTRTLPYVPACNTRRKIAQPTAVPRLGDGFDYVHQLKKSAAMKRRLKASDLLDIDLGPDVPYSPLKLYHPPQRVPIVGSFKVQSLQHMRIGTHTIRYRLTEEGEDVYVQV